MSIRRRLTIMLLASLFPLVLAIGAALFLFVRSSLLSRFDDGLAARADALMGATTWEDDVIDFDFDPVAMDEYVRENDPKYFELFAVDESTGAINLIEAAPALRGRTIEARSAFPPTDRIWSLSLPDGRAGRALSRTFRPRYDAAEVTDEESERLAAASARPGPLLGLVVAQGRSEVSTMLAELTIGLLGAGLLLCIAATLVVRFALGRALRPVESLAQAVQSVEPTHLDRRVDVGNLPPEIQQIQDFLNDLLQRMKATFERERRFTRAAAHELRTPAAELQLMLEVSGTRPRSSDEIKATMESALTSVRNLNRLIEALTRLARVQSGRESLQLVPTDIHRLVNNIVAEHPSYNGRIRVSASGASNAIVDAAMAQIAIDNLIRNSIEYGDAGSAVVIDIAATNGSVTLDIRNQAAHVSKEDIERIGEPFWRSDQARSDDRHMGLGVHMARTMIEAMHGQVFFDQPQPGTVRARARLHSAAEDARPRPTPPTATIDSR